MRNIFDQYSTPENRLSHALACTLEHDRSLLEPFLNWLGASIPKGRKLSIVQQRLPGTLDPDSPDDDERRGLPDICIHDDAEWVVLIESKVQDRARVEQLLRHERTLRRRQYDQVLLVLIAADPPPPGLEGKVMACRWRDVYQWFSERQSRSSWARHLVQYMEVFETKMMADDYEIRGTITKFTGLGFDDENPYSYPQAKRLIGLLGDELRRRPDLHSIGVDPDGAGRSAITGRAVEIVWDFLPLLAARGAYFTAYPHLTMAIGRSSASASITVPNGVKGGFRRRLRTEGLDGFVTLVAGIEKRLRPIITASEGAKPVIYALQRHYPSQRANPNTDGEIRADLRTVVPDGTGMTKYQPEWIACVHQLLVNKRSNIQLGLSVQFDYACPRVRSTDIVDLYAKAWIGMSPLLDFVVAE